MTLYMVRIDADFPLRCFPYLVESTAVESTETRVQLDTAYSNSLNTCYKFEFFITFIHSCVFIHVRACLPCCLGGDQRSSFRNCSLALHQMCPGDWTQAVLEASVFTHWAFCLPLLRASELRISKMFWGVNEPLSY